MRVLVILIVVAVALMFLGGWLYFRDSGSTSEVILDKQKVRQDTEEAVESGKEVLEKAARGLEKLGDEADDALSDNDASQATSSDKPAGQPADAR